MVPSTGFPNWASKGRHAGPGVLAVGATGFTHDAKYGLAMHVDIVLSIRMQAIQGSIPATRNHRLSEITGAGIRSECRRAFQRGSHQVRNVRITGYGGPIERV